MTNVLLTTMQALVGVCMGLAAVMASGTATAAPIHFGSAAWLTGRDCTGLSDQQICEGSPATRLDSIFIGGAYTATFFDGSSPNGLGSWFALSGANPSYLPVLHGGSWASDIGRVNTNMVAFQEFRFIGPARTPFSMIADLSFTTSGNSGGEYVGGGVTFAQMYFMDPGAFEGLDSAAEIMTLLGQDCSNPHMVAESAYGPGPLSAGDHQVQLTVNRTCSGSEMFLEPGQALTMVMVLQAASNRGGFMDATHTFVSNFDPTLPPETLRALRDGWVAVPEPTSYALVGLALTMVAAQRRRRRETREAATSASRPGT